LVVKVTFNSLFAYMGTKKTLFTIRPQAREQGSLQFSETLRNSHC